MNCITVLLKFCENALASDPTSRVANKLWPLKILTLLRPCVVHGISGKLSFLLIKFGNCSKFKM